GHAHRVSRGFRGFSRDSGNQFAGHGGDLRAVYCGYEGARRRQVGGHCQRGGRSRSTRGGRIRRFEGGRSQLLRKPAGGAARQRDRKSTRLNSSHVKISYAVFCLKKKKKK